MAPLLPPGLGPMQILREEGARDDYLRELDAEMREAVWRAPIYERQIKDDGQLVYGHHELSTGICVVNAPLWRTGGFTHELLHRMRPAFAERAVRILAKQLVHWRNDNATATFNETLLLALKASL